MERERKISDWGRSAMMESGIFVNCWGSREFISKILLTIKMFFIDILNDERLNQPSEQS